MNIKVSFSETRQDEGGQWSTPGFLSESPVQRVYCKATAPSFTHAL